MHGEFMYVFGGFDGTERLNDMWRVAPTAERPTWERIEQVRGGRGVGVDGERIILDEAG